MTSLSKREKILLYILLCVIISIGGMFFLIMPSLNKVSSLKSSLSELNTRLITVNAEQVDTTGVDAEYNELQKKHDELKKKFFVGLDVEDVDGKITQMAIKHKLTPKNLSVSQLADEEVISYTEYLEKLKLEQEAEAGETKDTEKKEDEQDKAANMMKVYNVALSVDGSIANLQAMVDEVNKSSSMKINAVTYDEQTGTKKEMNVAFKIFILENVVETKAEAKP